VLVPVYRYTGIGILVQQYTGTPVTQILEGLFSAVSKPICATKLLLLKAHVEEISEFVKLYKIGTRLHSSELNAVFRIIPQTFLCLGIHAKFAT